MSNSPMIRPETIPQPIQSEQSVLETSWITVFVVALLSAYLVHKLVTVVEAPLATSLEAAWNCFVYLMPSRLAFAFNSDSVPSGSTVRDAFGTHAAKSEILRRAFGLDTASTVGQDQAYSGRPPGLGNWDNSCYQNSVLQALASLQELKLFFDQLDVSLSAGLSNVSTLGALRGLIEELNDRSQGDRYIWTPAKLKSMSSWQQQDAQEYYSKMVDYLEKDIEAGYREQIVIQHGLHVLDLSLLNRGSYQESTESPDRGVDKAVRLSATALPKNGPDIPRLKSPLDGLLAQRVGCTRCGYSEGLSLIPFNCITLPLGREWHYDVRKCLDSFTSLEFIDGVECSKCTLLQCRSQLRELLEHSDNASVQGPPKNENTKFHEAIRTRLQAVSDALRDEDFSEPVIREACKIPKHMRCTTRKSRQAVIARAPKCLVMHVNRSVFDETTGNQLKNYADVHFPDHLDLRTWCVGNKLKLDLTSMASVEEWEMEPSRSMIYEQDLPKSPAPDLYHLKAVITHQGRHENGHYICYRTFSRAVACENKDVLHDITDTDGYERDWWRLSDEKVTKVTREDVLSQGGVFMLFYERLNQPTTLHAPRRGLFAEATQAVAHEHSGLRGEVPGATLSCDAGRCLLPVDPGTAELESMTDEAKAAPLFETMIDGTGSAMRSPVGNPQVASNESAAHRTYSPSPPALSSADRETPTAPVEAFDNFQRKQSLSPPAMRTGTPTPRLSDEFVPPSRSLRMVAI